MQMGQIPRADRGVRAFLLGWEAKSFQVTEIFADASPDTGELLCSGVAAVGILLCLAPPPGDARSPPLGDASLMV